MNQKKYSIIYGINPIIEIIKAKKRKIYKILVDREIPKTLDLFLKKNKLNKFIIEKISKNVLERISGSKETQGVIAYVDDFKFKKDFFDPNKNNLIVLFDKIQDPRNLGALLRTAYCTNITGVILSIKGSAPITGAAFKASAGLAEDLEIYEVNSSEKGASMAKEAGYEIYLADFGGKKIDEIILKNPTCIIIGSEGFGVTKSLHKYGQIVSLPQKRNDISYNASVAGGILMFDFSKKLKNL